MVKSRGATTSLLYGLSPCTRFQARVPAGGGLEGLFPLHASGANVGGCGSSMAVRPAPLSLQRQASSAPTDLHDPAVAWVWRQEQGIKADHDLGVRIFDKGRFYMYSWDAELYPFSCALESPPR